MMKKNIFALWRHLTHKCKNQLFILLLLFLLNSLIEVLSIGSIFPFLGALIDPLKIYNLPYLQSIISALDIKDPRGLLFPLTIIFVSFSLLSGAIRAFLLIKQTRLGYEIGAEFGYRIFRASLFQSYIFSTTRNSSEIIAAIASKTNIVVNQTILPILTIISSVFILILLILVVIIINPLVAISSGLGIFLIYVGIAYLTKNRLRIYGEQANLQHIQAIKILQEGLGGIREVVVDNTQEFYCASYRKIDNPLRRSIANIHIISNIPRYLIEALGFSIIAILAYVLSAQPDGVTTVIPILGGLALGAQRILPALQQIYLAWSSIQGSNAILNNILSLLGQQTPIYSDTAHVKPLNYKRNIKLRNVTFKYSPELPNIVKGVDLEIKKGSRVGIIGKTGSGKSTLLDIIMGLLPLKNSGLLIDEVVVNETNYQAWRCNIAHVPQNIFLSDSSIAENIAFGIDINEINYEKIKKVAAIAQIDKTIDNLEDKYNTIVGERGVKLSGGQRQRIGIARALYKDVDVLILDEATSALDDATEVDVIKAIESMGNELTIIMVAHRISTLKNCDQVIEIVDGKIHYIGSYEGYIKGGIV